MVKKSTIKARQNERWEMPPEIARHYSEVRYLTEPDENGRTSIEFDEPPEPKPEGYGACWDYCKRWTPHTTYVCAWGNCTNFVCTVCNRIDTGMGPVGCPCDEKGGLRGHHTRAEQPRPTFKRRKK